MRWSTYVSPPVPCINDGRTNNKIRCGTYVNSPVLTEDGSIIQLGGDGFVYQFDRATGKQLWKVETAPPWIAANEGTPTVVKDGSIFQMTAGESTRLDELRRSVRIVAPPGPYSLAASDSPLLITVSNELPVGVQVELSLSETSGLRAGVDFGEIGEDGKLRRIVGFFDPPPEASGR